MSKGREREWKRHETLMALIEYLNERNDYTPHVYDVEPLGILHVWYASSWKWTWYDPKPLPSGVMDKILGR